MNIPHHWFLQSSQPPPMETVEDCRVSPPLGTVPAGDLPLTFLDVHWFAAPPVQRLFFYSLPYDSSRLSRTVVADLKNSLAVALCYFYPYAGKIIFPPLPQKPYISIEDGGSVRLTVVESKSDFGHLSSDRPRKAAEIRTLVPRLPPPYEETGVKKYTLMEIQITLFPDFGISIGATYLHAVADGRSFSNFMKTWAAIHKSQGDTSWIQSTLPCHDRHLIKDEKDISSVFMKDIFRFEDLAPGPDENVRLTFRISNAEIAMLKEKVKNLNDREKAESLHVSTFVVCVAYVWVCLTKLEEQRTHCEQDTNTLCHLFFPVDFREQLVFPVPTTYFGNCIGVCFSAAKKHELVGANGLVFAARAIMEEVHRAREEPLAQVENWLAKVGKIVSVGKYFLTLAGSPKFRVYETDFGWGKPKKTDCAHIVSYGAVSVEDGGRNEDGGVELGLAVDQSELDTLTALFEQGLKLPEVVH